MRQRALVIVLLLLIASPAFATVARETNGTAQGVIAAGSSFNASLGSGISDGDVVFVVAHYKAGGKTLTPPSGYSQPSGTYQCSYFSASADLNIYVHVWHTGDPTSSLTFTVLSGGNFTGGTWNTVAYKGADQTPILVAAQFANVGSNTSLTSPSLTPTSTTDMLLMIYGAITDNATYSGPSEGTINVQGPSGTGNGTSAIADNLLASGAATGNQTINISPASFACGMQIAIAPPQPTATATPTPFPSQTPTATSTAPTATATPTRTATPTATPTPFPTPTPTATATACAGPYQTIARRTPNGITVGSCNGAATCTMPEPAGTKDGDFMILIFNWGFPIVADTIPNDPPQNWTLVKWSGPLSGVSTEQWIYAKIWHTGDLTDVTYACTDPGTCTSVTGDWAIGAYSGVDPRLIFSVGSQINIPSTTPVSPSLNGSTWPLPNTPKDMLFMVYGTKTAGQVFSAPSEGSIWAQSNSFFPTVGVDFLLSSASATGNQNITITSSDNNAGMQASFAPACYSNWFSP